MAVILFLHFFMDKDFMDFHICVIGGDFIWLGSGIPERPPFRSGPGKLWPRGFKNDVLLKYSPTHLVFYRL